MRLRSTDTAESTPNGWLRRALAASAVVVGLTAVVGGGVAAQDDDPAAPEREELSTARKQRQAATDELGDLQLSADELVGLIAELDLQIGARQAELDAARTHETTTRARLVEATRRVDESRAAVADAEERLRSRAVQAYVQPSPLFGEELIRPAESLDDVKRQVLAEVVLDDDRRVVESLSETKERLEVDEAELESAVVAAAAAERAAEVALDDVADQRRRQQEARDLLTERIDELESEIAALEAQEAELREIIAQREAAAAAAAAAAAGETEASVGSGWLWPTRGWVSSEFGPRWGRNHNGIDLAAPTGTPVVASRGGVVFHAGRLGSFGNLVAIDHGDGFTTFYAHLSTVGVSRGQWVNAGEHVAEVGSTGRSTGPHLHFEIRRHGVAENPRRHLG